MWFINLVVYLVFDSCEIKLIMFDVSSHKAVDLEMCVIPLGVPKPWAMSRYVTNLGTALSMILYTIFKSIRMLRLKS